MAQGVPLVDASLHHGTKPGGVLGGQAGSRAVAPPQRGGTPGGVVGGSEPRTAEASLHPDEIIEEMDVIPVEEQEEIDESPLDKNVAKIFRGVPVPGLPRPRLVEPWQTVCVLQLTSRFSSADEHTCR